MSSLPPCFTLLNAAYFENLSAQISACSSGAQLQALTNQIMADISLLESTITSQLSFLQPIQALLTAPEANPAAIVTWITSFIESFLTPYLKPIANMTAQLAAFAGIVATLTTAIENAAKNLGVEITIPAISIGCTL